MPALAYFDCPSGAAGDMILGALVDAGSPCEDLRADLARLALGGYALERREVMKGAFRATKVDVHVHGADAGRVRHGIPRASRAPAPHPPGDPRPHRPERPAGRGEGHAIRIFTRLAEAEGAGARRPRRTPCTSTTWARWTPSWTSSAPASASTCLGVDAVHCSALPIGGGMVNGPHGRIPVPAPGTAELLEGFPVVDTGVQRELVTPTGAAILTTLAASAGRMPPMTVPASATGRAPWSSRRPT